MKPGAAGRRCKRGACVKRLCSGAARTPRLPSALAIHLRARRRRWTVISERDGAPCSPSAAAPAPWWRRAIGRAIRVRRRVPRRIARSIGWATLVLWGRLCQPPDPICRVRPGRPGWQAGRRHQALDTSASTTGSGARCVSPNPHHLGAPGHEAPSKSGRLLQVLFAQLFAEVLRGLPARRRGVKFLIRRARIISRRSLRRRFLPGVERGAVATGRGLGSVYPR